MNEEQYIQQLENEVNIEKEGRTDAENRFNQSIFQSEGNDNLIRWQLDIKEELERIEHLLRGHIPRIDKQGNEYWKEPEDKDEVIFNEKGIREILQILSWYLNKNFILSNYSEEDIKLRVHQFGRAIVDLIHNKYEEFGWDNPEKLKHYEMVVLNLVNTVEATYFRALNGGERESLRTARHVTQSEPIGMMGSGYQQHKPKTSIFKPSTWR